MSQDIYSVVMMGKFQKDGAVPNMPELGSFGVFYSSGGTGAAAVERGGGWNETLMFHIANQGG